MNILIRGTLSDTEREAVLQVIPGADITICPAKEDVTPYLAVAEIILGQLSPEKLPLAKRLRLLQVTSAGVDRLLSTELSNSKAALCTASGIHGETIAEHVLMMMLAMARQLPTYVHAQKAHVWKAVELNLLYGKVFGIVGFGSIGEQLGVRAKAFGMRVIGIRRRKTDIVDPHMADEIWGEEDLDRLLSIADHLVIAVPLTPATRGLMSDDKFNLMKQSAIIYNIARGPVIDQGALIKALTTGSIAGAGLDVFEVEPLPEDSRLWDMPNVIVTPHSAGGMPDYRERAFAIFVDNLRRLRDGEKLINEVDKEAGYQTSKHKGAATIPNWYRRSPFK